VSNQYREQDPKDESKTYAQKVMPTLEQEMIQERENVD
jgi:hypothetical protein